MTTPDNPDATIKQVEEAAPAGPQPLLTDEELANVRAIKLTNGEDIIAAILAFNPHILIVKRPAKVIRIANENGTVACVLMKWQAFSNDETHTITMNNVVSYSKITQEMLDYYMKSVAQQMEEEQRGEMAADALASYQWPAWMDSPTKTQIN